LEPRPERRRVGGAFDHHEPGLEGRSHALGPYTHPRAKCEAERSK
jgi:ribosome modulation factor